MAWLDCDELEAAFQEDGLIEKIIKFTEMSKHFDHFGNLCKIVYAQVGYCQACDAAFPKRFGKKSQTETRQADGTISYDTVCTREIDGKLCHTKWTPANNVSDIP